MSQPSRPGTAGATRECPHCKATILESSVVCPACKHYLRYDSDARPATPAQVPLQVEGTIRHPATGEAWEYSVVVVIRDARGQEIARKVVGVGAMLPGDERSFSLAVEVFEAKGTKARKH
ncbi:MAG: hypothetical protein JF600_16100 [Xanthomonadales bacterium]|nr:hypothetical protein [Xanthomonadales bacterium]